MKPFALSTGEMAKYLGISRDFLTNNKDVIFKKGVHYNIPPGRTHPLWIVQVMEKWLMDETPMSQKAQEVWKNLVG